MQTGLRSNDLIGTDPKRAELHRQASRQRVHGAAVLRAGLRPAVRGFGSDCHQYCAAMTIDSLTRGPEPRHPNSNGDPTTRPTATTTCLAGPSRSTGPTSPGTGALRRRPTRCSRGRWTVRTPRGEPRPDQGPADEPGGPDPVHMHDTPAGFQIVLVDLTTGQSGSMTASVANGFGHILYTPNSSTCRERPYAFHPEYSTASAREYVERPYVQHRDVGRDRPLRELPRDQRQSTAPSPASGFGRHDEDDRSCVPGTDSTLVISTDASRRLRLDGQP